MAKAYTPPLTGGRHIRGTQAPKSKGKQFGKGIVGIK